MPVISEPYADLSPLPLVEEDSAPSVSRAYVCQCGRPVYLGNSQCLACGTTLGYVVERPGVVPLTLAPPMPAPPGLSATPIALPPAEGPVARYTLWGRPGGTVYQRCANFSSAAGCNWMRPVHGSDDALALTPGFCLSCSLTRTIPDLSWPGNGELWRKLESSKRRLLSQLLALGLPLTTREADPVRGLAFDFLHSQSGGPGVLTGHRDGIITLNIEEAEDEVREHIRARMHEPYRTLLGHFRHEIGHYYWDSLVQDSPDWLAAFRSLFGDERSDYAQALQQHYRLGPRADWAQWHVSSYASVHPWEDWAETWAHYLHMADAIDTALSFHVDAAEVEMSASLFTLSDLWQPEHPQAERFLDFLNGWVHLTGVLNELSRSMGQPDFYPFVLPRAVAGKLQFIHELIAEQRSVAPPEPMPPAAPRPGDLLAAAVQWLRGRRGG